MTESFRKILLGQRGVRDEAPTTEETVIQTGENEQTAEALKNDLTVHLVLAIVLVTAYCVTLASEFETGKEMAEMLQSIGLDLGKSLAAIEGIDHVVRSLS